jgi:hypothetical protein
MSTLSEEVDRRTAARYAAVLGETATDLLARSDRARRQLTPPILDRVDPGEPRSARSVGEVIRSLARVATVICRWTYERVTL